MKVEVIKGNHKRNYKSQKLRVAAYVRVSTELEAQTNSFESQRKYFLTKINRNSNWKFVGIYEDYGKSGRSIKNRTGFNNLIKDALDGKIDLILTKSVSRFARNTFDSIEYVRLLRKHNIGVIFEEESIYTLDMKSELLLTILSSVAQQESDNASSRIKKAIQMNMQNGKVRKKVAVYGYKVKDGKLLIVKKEAEVIRRIFNLYVEGYGTQQICNLLNNEKVKSPYKKKWNPNYIHLIITCKKYIGIIKFGDTYKYESIRIISDDIFYKAKERMTNNRSQLKEGVDILSGIVRCGFCGRVRGFASNTGYYASNVCKARGCKTGINIHVDQVNRILLEFQNELLENYNEIFKIQMKDDFIQKQKAKKLEKDFYQKALFSLEEMLQDRVNKYEFINEMNALNMEHDKYKESVKLKDINNERLNYTLNILKERLINIDSFPADEVSKELVNKLVKYIQFGETLKHNYKNMFNCRIVLKVDENYSANKFKKKVDYSTLCKNEYYFVLWEFKSVYIYKSKKKYIKVRIVIDKRDIEVH